MKIQNYTWMVLSIFLLSSCGSTVKFPVSNVVPAAEIKVTTKVDKNKNNQIEIVANNMASPDRLNPPGNAYVIWAVTDDNMLRNLGQLINKNSKKSTFKTSTPFEITEIFITAEERGDLTRPNGQEISRVRL
jgi:hypothetical protein